MSKTKLIGFGEPVVGTKDQMAEAIMFGKHVLRDEEATYYEYKGCLYVMSLTDAVPSSVKTDKDKP